MPLLALLCFAATPGDFSELDATVGGEVMGYAYGGGRRSEGFLLVGGEGRFRPEKVGSFADRFILEGGALAIVPIVSLGSAFGAAGTLRAGLQLGWFRFTIGAHARIDATPAPFSILPSLTLSFRPGAVGIFLGLLDRPGGPLAHVALQWKNIFIGYVAPIGAELGGKVALGPKMAIDVRLSGHTIGTAYGISLIVRIAFGQGLVWEDS